MHTPQLVATENKLIASVGKLQSKNRVFGELPTTEESPYAFRGGDLEIVKQVNHEKKLKSGEIIEVAEEEGEEEDEPDTDSSNASIRFGGGEMNTTELTKQLRQFRAHLFREDLQNARQTNFEEDVAVPTLGNPSNLTHAIGDGAGAELLDPPKDITVTLEQQPEEAAKPIPTLDSRPRLRTDALPPKPSSAAHNSFSYRQTLDRNGAFLTLCTSRIPGESEGRSVGH
ncbi:hypothetical protein EI94DRAFT_1801248 [Lactarius quietus]|nr:hypothetical protein EI94DRAFT_1801248 [Lactarius quietus]